MQLQTKLFFKFTTVTKIHKIWKFSRKTRSQGGEQEDEIWEDFGEEDRHAHRGAVQGTPHRVCFLLPVLQVGFFGFLKNFQIRPIFDPLPKN